MFCYKLLVITTFVLTVNIFYDYLFDDYPLERGESFIELLSALSLTVVNVGALSLYYSLSNSYDVVDDYSYCLLVICLCFICSDLASIELSLSFAEKAD